LWIWFHVLRPRSSRRLKRTTRESLHVARDLLDFNLIQIENDCWPVGLFFRQLSKFATLHKMQCSGGVSVILADRGRDSFGQHMTKRIEALEFENA